MKKIVITTGIVAIAGGVATALLMPSCEPDCEVMAKPSIILTLVAQDGGDAQIRPDKLWFEWTDGEGNTVQKNAACGDDECNEWTLGEGLPGHYSYHATVCGRQFDGELDLDFGADGCNVDTQLVDLPVSMADCRDVKGPDEPTPPTLELPSWVRPKDTACTMEARFSVIASLYTERDGRAVPIGADRAYFILDPAIGEGKPGQGKGWGHEKHQGEGHDKGQGKGHGEDVERGEEIPAMCLDQNCTSFGAGLELEGKILVGAEACGQIVEATVEVSRTPDGCHVATQRTVLNFDGPACMGTPIYEPPPPPSAQCPSALPAPSAYIWPVYQKDDMLISLPTTALTYTVGDFRDVGYCAREAANGKCAMWISGWGRSGEFTAYTDACGAESAISYTVSPAEDGCGPQTEYVLAFVDTRGCITTPSFGGEPPPDSPVAGEDITR